jgi:hypothetical protein
VIEKYKPKNRIEFLEMIDRMLEREYENVNINLKIDGLEVEYDLVEGEHQACFIPYPDFFYFQASEKQGRFIEKMKVKV